jgi:hypothetical protein
LKLLFLSTLFLLANYIHQYPKTDYKSLDKLFTFLEFQGRDATATNITLFTNAAWKNTAGLFYFKEYNTYVSESHFSLLKFDQPEEDYDPNLACLAANISISSNYIRVFPVSCSANIATAFLCVFGISPLSVTFSIKEGFDPNTNNYF